MILRNITQHVKDQNWFAVLLDFIIVVVGILLAFQITNWSEARSDQALEKQYLSLLARDLETIEATLTAQINHEVEITNAAAKALAEINGYKDNMDPLPVG